MIVLAAFIMDEEHCRKAFEILQLYVTRSLQAATVHQSTYFSPILSHSLVMRTSYCI